MPALTAFEQRVVAEAQPDWCSREEETAFLDALVAGSNRVSYSSIGKTVNNRDIWAVIVAAPSQVSFQDRHHCLVSGAIHGDEGSGREGSFQFMRDLAETADAGLVQYLQEVAWVFVPTLNTDNPRRWQDGSRFNSNGRDLNRAHYALDQPESVAWQTLIRDLNPVLMLDLHEHGSSGNGTDMNRGRNTEIAQGIRNDGDAIVVACRAAVEAAGFESGIYASTGSFATNTNSIGLRHSITILSETRRISRNDDNVPPRADRALMQKTVLNAALTYHRNNMQRLAQQRADAIAATIQKGVTGEAFNLQNGQVVAVAGYQVLLSNWNLIQHVAKAYNLSAFKSDGEIVVYRSQRSGDLLPMMLDPLIAPGSNLTPLIPAERLSALPVPDVRFSGRLTSPSVVYNGLRSATFRVWN